MDRPQVILDLVCGYLDEDAFTYHTHSDRVAVEGGIRGKTAPFPFRIAVEDDPLSVSVFIQVPLVVPEDRRAQMAEAIVRANYGLLFGCFDLDMSDGTMGFRNSLALADGTVTHEQFRRLLGPAMGTADRYHRAFCRLLFGDDLSPAEVIAEVEMAETDD